MVSLHPGGGRIAPYIAIRQAYKVPLQNGIPSDRRYLIDDPAGVGHLRRSARQPAPAWRTSNPQLHGVAGAQLGPGLQPGLQRIHNVQNDVLICWRQN